MLDFLEGLIPPEVELWGAAVFNNTIKGVAWQCFEFSKKEVEREAAERREEYQQQHPDQSLSPPCFVQLGKEGAETTLRTWLTENDVLGAENNSAIEGLTLQALSMLSEAALAARNTHQEST